jgi:hypothetical protein
MGIQPTSPYAALSLIANVPQQRNTSARATHSFDTSSANLADKTVISQAARDLAAQESSNAARYSNATQTADQRFPPANTPAGVSLAWSAATQGMSDMDRLVAEGAFMAEEISANLRFDSTGRAVGIRQHGEPGYVDLWNQPGVSYPEQVELMLEKLEQNQSSYTAKDYAFFRDVLTGFRAALLNG